MEEEDEEEEEEEEFIIKLQKFKVSNPISCQVWIHVLTFEDYLHLLI